MLGNASKLSWSDVQNVSDAEQLVRVGVLLLDTEVRTVYRRLTPTEIEQVTGLLAEELAREKSHRLADEIIIESTLLLLRAAKDEKPLQSFLESLLQAGNFKDAAFKLVELSLQTEMTEDDSNAELLCMAVTLICEMGLAIDDLQFTFPEEFGNVGSMLDHISTFLMSVSNTDNQKIRLSLFHYFGNVSRERYRPIGFNKIVSRFGHTMLENLFDMLFEKKTEAVAFQFLIENLPNMLRCDHNAQNIIHETMRFYMLKHPDRFGYFIESFAERMEEELKASDAEEFNIEENFFGHLGALLRVVSDINHRNLTYTLLATFHGFKNNVVKNEIIRKLVTFEDIRESVREILAKMLVPEDDSRTEKIIGRLSERKRGRRPVFTNRAEGMHGFSQIDQLGDHFDAPKKKAS